MGALIPEAATILLALAALGVIGAACRDEAPTEIDREALARQALDDGQPKRALSEIGDAREGAALVLRLQALIALDEWGTFERLVATVPAGQAKDALMCLLASARRDVFAHRVCGASFDGAVIGRTLHDHARRALAFALETEKRRDEAEVVLRELARESPTGANHKAVVAFLERQGFVREAVAYLEGWLAASPSDKTIEFKLVQVLERKVRGDLLDKRAAEAEAAARRILALAPARAQVRYFLADALELKGDKTAAEAERALAKAAGAAPPVPVDVMPGMLPDGPGHPGHDGHDHP